MPHRLNMGSKTRLSSYCSKRVDDTVNLVTSCKTKARLARPINRMMVLKPFNETMPLFAEWWETALIVCSVVLVVMLMLVFIGR